jgi:hypothetical protein
MPGRRLTGMVATALGTLVVASPAAAQTVAPGTADGASVVKVGWWWRANDSTPADDTSVGVPQPRSPRVPEGSLPVTAVGGEPEKMSAVEFSIDAPAGSTVDSFTLALRENAEPDAALNQQDAAILACPVTDVFWAHGQGARWSTRPAYDCQAGQVGKRGDEGVWTFDLTGLAKGWTSAFPTRAPAVVLVEDVGAPESFQVTFDGVAAKGIGLRVETTPPPATGTTGTTGTDRGGEAVTAGGAVSGAAVPNDIGAPAGGGPAGPLPGVGSGSVPSGAGAPSLPTVAAGAPLPATGGGVPEVAPPVARASTAIVSTPPPPWYAGISWAGFLLVPFALGLAYVAMLALGPDAQPATGGAQHGVGRALERLQRMRDRVKSRGAPR